MLKHALAYCLLGSAMVLVGPALAQNQAPASQNPAPAPQANNPPANVKFVEVRPQGQFRASKLIGSRVTGSNDENIGEINDVLMDQQGRVHAVILGVGGFLGIGEKDVAIPITELKFMADDNRTVRRDTTTTTGAVTNPNPPAATTAPPSANANPNAGNAPARTDNNAVRTNNTAARDDDDGIPDRIVLSMTKEQLSNAPKFQDERDTQRRTNNTAPANAPANANPPATAPRQ